MEQKELIHNETEVHEFLGLGCYFRSHLQTRDHVEDEMIALADFDNVISFYNATAIKILYFERY